MLPASNRGPGMALGFPDVCLTPSPAGPVPVPYPNIAMNAQAAPFSASVKVNMMNALNLASQIPLTSGDEAGSAHPTVKQAQRYTMGSPNVFIEGMPGITLASITNHNNMNCPVGAVIVPSAVNVLFSYLPEEQADPRTTRALDAQGLAELGLAASGESVTAAGIQGDTGVLVIGAFGLGAGAEVHAAVARLVAAGASQLVIDLRGAAGGALEGGLAAASQFVREGETLVVELEADGDELEHRSTGGVWTELPLTIAIDGLTASTAEVFAGALRDLGRARLVGERSYGKGVSHRVAITPEGNAVAARLSSLRLPSGALIDGVGLTP